MKNNKLKSLLLGLAVLPVVLSCQSCEKKAKAASQSEPGLSADATGADKAVLMEPVDAAMRITGNQYVISSDGERLGMMTEGTKMGVGDPDVNCIVDVTCKNVHARLKEFVSKEDVTTIGNLREMADSSDGCPPGAHHFEVTSERMTPEKMKKFLKTPVRVLPFGPSIETVNDGHGAECERGTVYLTTKPEGYMPEAVILINVDTKTAKTEYMKQMKKVGEKLLSVEDVLNAFEECGGRYVEPYGKSMMKLEGTENNPGLHKCSYKGPEL